MGHSQIRPGLLQKADSEVDTLLFSGGQAIPPFAEFIGELNFPSRGPLCHVGHYAVNDIKPRWHFAARKVAAATETGSA
jgi:hypothetical protein